MNAYETAYNRLNPEQKKAVDTIEGPVMVVAGPGTGKTQVLALRIATILQKTDSHPSNILCLTFTEAGVRAMRERLQRFIGNDAFKVAIHTFHSFANEVIQTFPEEFTFKKELVQLDDINRVKLLQGIITKLEDENPRSYSLIPFHDPFRNIRLITSAIQTLKKENTTPDELRTRNEKLKEAHESTKKINKRTGKPTIAWQKFNEKLEKVDELALIYELYQKELEDAGYYDYEDMIMFVIREFEQNDSLLGYYQEQFLYMHVDEYQDTNGSQNRIVELLGSWDSSPNIFVVGDDDQAIYRFQGASLDNILFFNKHFSGVRTIPITTNYRSTQIILDAADSVIANNQTRLTNEVADLSKKLQSYYSKSENNAGTHAVVHEFETADEENIFLAQKIKTLTDSGVHPSDIAILVRRNMHIEDIAEALQSFEISTTSNVGNNIFSLPLIQNFVRLLELLELYPKQAEVDLYHTLLADFFAIEPADVYRITRYSHDTKQNLIDVLVEIATYSPTEVNENTLFTEDNAAQKALIEKMHNLLKLQAVGNLFLNWHAREKNIALPKLIEIILAESGILKQLGESSEDSSFEETLAINAFFRHVNSQYQLNPSISLKTFLEDITLANEQNVSVSIGPVGESKESVQLLTAHGSKGLEFEHVFIAKATDSNWGKPGRSYSLLPNELFEEEVLEKSDEKELAIEDERRLFFVALTRAKRFVYISSAKQYEEYGSTKETEQSRFVDEIPESLINEKETEIEISKESYLQKLHPATSYEYSSAEKEFLEEHVAKFKLSPSSLNLYIANPEQFKLQNLIRIPEAKNKHAALGTGVHAAMELFNRNYQKNNEVTSLESMLAIFEKTLQKEFEGYEEYEKTKIEGQEIIKEYYEAEIAGSSAFPKIAEIEYAFFAHNVYLPNPDGDAIPLSGRIDLVEYLDKSLNEVRVIDYKTKRPVSANYIQGKTKQSDGAMWRQLVFYTLLGELDSKFRKEKSLNNSKYAIREAGISFLRPNNSGIFKTESFTITENDKEELRQIIFEVMEKIRNLEFPGEPTIEV